jgi:hypothetical protein
VFNHLTESEKHDVFHKYGQAAHGSFLLAGLQLRCAENKESATDIFTILKTYKTVEEVLDRQLASLDAKRSETKHLLSWLVAAERPSALKEIKALLEVDLDGCEYRPFSGDIEMTVRQLCGSLVIIRDGLHLRPSLYSRPTCLQQQFPADH